MLHHVCQEATFSNFIVMPTRQPGNEVFYLGGNEKKNSREELSKIEARFADRKQKMNSLKIQCRNVKRKLNSMEQVQMEY